MPDQGIEPQSAIYKIAILTVVRIRLGLVLNILTLSIFRPVSSLCSQLGNAGKVQVTEIN